MLFYAILIFLGLISLFLFALGIIDTWVAPKAEEYDISYWEPEEIVRKDRVYTVTKE